MEVCEACGKTIINSSKSMKKHPFEITCKNCGSHRVRISAEDYCDIEIMCEACGTYTHCGRYHGKDKDYSRMTTYGEKRYKHTEWYD